MVNKRTAREDEDERLSIPLDREEAVRDLLKVDADAPPVKEALPAKPQQDQEDQDQRGGD
jgi:hypothetical protein